MQFRKSQFEPVRHLLPLNAFTWSMLLLSLCCYLFIGYGLSREQFTLYFSCYLLLFVACLQLLKRNEQSQHDQPGFKNTEGLSAESTGLLLNRKSDLHMLLAAAIVFRLVFLFSIPALSDDYFRFAWDGFMWTHGENPYTIIPAAYLHESGPQPHYLMELFNSMNSPKYYTVYPPVCQFIFGISAQLFPSDLLGAVIMMRIFCIAAEIGTIILLLKILTHFNLPRRNVLLYALNPLVIMEGSSSLHFEVIMIFFLLLAIYLLIQASHHIKPVEEPFSFFSPKQTSQATKEQSKNSAHQPSPAASRKLIYSALSFSAAISVKLIPLLFLPFLIRRLKWKNSLLYFFVTGSFFILLLLPFLNQQLLTQWGSSLQLYFQHFEFNASIYYVVRWMGFQFVHYDIVRQAGPLLAIITFISVLFLAVKEKETSWKYFFHTIQWSLTIYLLLATTVHPWYIVTLVMCSVITGYKYPLVWSLFIALSYATYQTIPYQENLALVAIEYTAVIGVLIFELKMFRKKKQLPFHPSY
ncbi:MAG: hypothetical protein ABI729_05285 [Chitinophagales bacterium]